MSPVTDITDIDDPVVADAYHTGYSEGHHKGYETGYGVASLSLNGTQTLRRERWIAVTWCAVGLLAGVYLRGWWV